MAIWYWRGGISCCCNIMSTTAVVTLLHDQHSRFERRKSFVVPRMPVTQTKYTPHTDVKLTSQWGTHCGSFPSQIFKWPSPWIWYFMHDIAVTSLCSTACMATGVLQIMHDITVTSLCSTACMGTGVLQIMHDITVISLRSTACMATGVLQIRVWHAGESSCWWAMHTYVSILNSRHAI